MTNLKEVGIGWNPKDDYQSRILKQRARMAIKRAWRHQMKVDPTPAEAAAKHLLKRLGVKFTPQAIVHGFIPDFWCAVFRVAVEIDGSSHNSRLDYDSWRDGILSGSKIEVVRLTNNEVFDYPATCIARVEAAMKRQAATWTKKRKQKASQNCTGIAADILRWAATKS